MYIDAFAKLSLEVVGFSDAELNALLADADPQSAPLTDREEEIPAPPAVPVTRTGDLWEIGRHRLICGDCRDSAVVARLFGGAFANCAITSPPYATQREYDPASGFQPVPPAEYVEWYRAIAANIATVLTPDGSYFLNVKEHADEGERSLYVKDLVIAHRRIWGWRFVDEFCWRKTDNGVPGAWNNRFKNAWEPVFHFCRQPAIKFHPEAVGHGSDECFEYSPTNPESRSGSGLLGCGEGREAGRFSGIARPSNVIEAYTECRQGSHSAPFPSTLVQFFVKAFSDSGDIVFDPFLGSGTTMAAAHVLGRRGYGIEISPSYCDVILRRIWHLASDEPVLAGSGQTLSQVAAARGISLDQIDNDACRIGSGRYEPGWSTVDKGGSR